MSLVLRLVLAASAAPAMAAPEPAELVKAHSFPFNYEGGFIRGSGADRILAATASSQFVLLGEDHYEFQTPIFAGALFRTLRRHHGFRHLIVEQDPIAIEDALSADYRGNAGKLGLLARRYPSLFEYASDQDLALLADVGRLERGETAICGVEQATGAVRYLDELTRLAQTSAAREKVGSLRAWGMKLDPAPKYSVNFLIHPETPQRLADLRDAFAPRQGTRADKLIGGLEKSAEIFGYYRRAEAGEPVGLFNNTVREDLFKSNFMSCYAKARRTEKAPKALFKFGLNHAYRGRNATNAFPIGNFAHEFAISNGMDAYGIAVAAIPEARYGDVPAYLRMLLPTRPPAQPMIIDLRALRPYQHILRAKIDAKELEPFLSLVNGFDAIVFLPGAKPAEMSLSGLQRD